MKFVFALVDCNNFYASCERLFRPELEGKPVVVLSNNDGCIIARSNEAKSLGIPMGAPYFKNKTLIEENNVHVFSSNYALYGDLSQRVMYTLLQMEPEVEIYSIDEAFIRLPQTNIADVNLTKYALSLRKKIKQNVGIPVSIGIGPTKTLAKIANRIAKKDINCNGVFDLTTCGDVNSLLGGMDVRDIWGIGRKNGEKLNKHNIFSALDLKNSNDEWVRKQLTVVGLRTVMELRGTPCIPIDHEPPPRKSVVSSRSFRKPVSSRTALGEAVSSYVSVAAEKLRQEKLVAGNLHVFIRTSPHRTNLPQHSGNLMIRLDQPTASTPALIKAALQGLKKIYKENFSYQKAGVMLTELTSSTMRQQNLFQALPQDNKAVMAALDKINNRWGRNTVQYASSGIDKPWCMSQEHKSAAYTTRWDELPVVNAAESSTGKS